MAHTAFRWSRSLTRLLFATLAAALLAGCGDAGRPAALVGEPQALKARMLPVSAPTEPVLPTPVPPTSEPLKGKAEPFVRP